MYRKNGSIPEQLKDERLKIGVVTQLARSSFMQEVNRGIEKAAVELKEKGSS